MRTYDDWKTDVGVWPSVGDRHDGAPLRRAPWSRPPRGEEPTPRTVLDLTGSTETAPEVLDLAGDDPPGLQERAEVVLDLTADPLPLALAELLTTPVGQVDPVTRRFLVTVYDRLTPAEQVGLVQEAEGGDLLARHILAVLEQAGTAPLIDARR
jgi:hypothetical protein